MCAIHTVHALFPLAYIEQPLIIKSERITISVKKKKKNRMKCK